MASEPSSTADTKDPSAEHTTSTAPTSVNSDKAQGTSRSRESTQSNYAASSNSSGMSRGRPRTRSDLSNPLSSTNLEKRGYHTFACLGKDFHVDKRWKLVRELGQGAYGIVVLAQDSISGENVAIKLVTRVFDKKELAKRALREIALLRHFNNHENITGLIDMDLLSPDFNEIYLFMEPMEADLHQIIRSGQILTNAHVQYFLYQLLRGCKYIHSADVVHRDLKPGNLLVNADCELKICDLGLSRGFDRGPDEESVTHMTEYVATRWYRAPEIMLSFRRYGTAIDVWSIGCILGELLGGKPMFKGKDYVDQLNIILKVLGTPPERTIKKIGSEKAQAYIKSLPIKQKVPFETLFPTADHQALDLLKKMLAFDPADRINVLQALEHPYLESYHEIGDEPECPTKFTKWKEIEEIESDFDYRKAIWKEVYDFRLDVRTVEGVEPSEDTLPQDAAADLPAPDEHPIVESPAVENTVHKAALADADNSMAVPEVIEAAEKSSEPVARGNSLEPPLTLGAERSASPLPLESVPEDTPLDQVSHHGRGFSEGAIPFPVKPPPPSAPIPFPSTEDASEASRPIPRPHARAASSASTATLRPTSGTVDPYTTYARRTSLLFTSYSPMQHGPSASGGPDSSGGGGSYIVPMRSRAPSTDNGALGGPLLRTLSTGGLAALVEKKTAAAITQADLPPSALPTAFKSEQSASAEAK